MNGKESQVVRVENVALAFRHLISDQLGVLEEEVTPSASFVDDLGADSLDTIEVIMACEERFGLEITDDEAETIRTVAEAVAYLERRVAAKPPARA